MSDDVGHGKDRKARLGAALRENLKRRKMQARGRVGRPIATPEDDVASRDAAAATGEETPWSEAVPLAGAGLFPRFPQMFPELTPGEIGRIRSFGSERLLPSGEALFKAGETNPGMVVVLAGRVALTRRDGMGHVLPVIEQGPGQFLAELNQLSGRPVLVEGRAKSDVRVLAISTEKLQTLLAAEAELGERIMRALILRRVGLVQSGAGGPVLIGPSLAGGTMRLQAFLSHNGCPYHMLDPATDKDAADLAARHNPGPHEWPLVVCPDGSVLRNPQEYDLACAMGSL